MQTRPRFKKRDDVLAADECRDVGANQQDRRIVRARPDCAPQCLLELVDSSDFVLGTVLLTESIGLVGDALTARDTVDHQNAASVVGQVDAIKALRKNDIVADRGAKPLQCAGELGVLRQRGTSIGPGLRLCRRGCQHDDVGLLGKLGADGGDLLLLAFCTDEGCRQDHALTGPLIFSRLDNAPVRRWVATQHGNQPRDILDTGRHEQPVLGSGIGGHLLNRRDLQHNFGGHARNAAARQFEIARDVWPGEPQRLFRLVRIQYLCHLTAHLCPDPVRHFIQGSDIILHDAGPRRSIGWFAQGPKQSPELIETLCRHLDGIVLSHTFGASMHVIEHDGRGPDRLALED
ncbi:hypothetical protein D9M72_235480 [compost metagenome]